MNSISVIIIAKNEETMIADCLESVRKLADEIIVVDGGSTDRTIEVAKHMGAKVIEVKLDSFSHMRNAGLEKAKGDWVFYLDADERATSSLVENIKYQVLSIEEQKFAAFKVLRKNYYFGNHEWPYIEKIERLFRREKLKMWKGKLHESPVIEGDVGVLDGYLLHYTHRDLTSMLEKTISWSEIEAELRLKSHHPKITWWRFPRVILTAFFDSYVAQKGWKAGTAGLIESLYQGFSMFITYARLWELQQKK